MSNREYGSGRAIVLRQVLDPDVPLAWFKQIGTREVNGERQGVYVFAHGAWTYWLSGVICAGEVSCVNATGHLRLKDAIARAELIAGRIDSTGTRWIGGSIPQEIAESLRHKPRGGGSGRPVILKACKKCGEEMPTSKVKAHQARCGVLDEWIS